MTASLPPELEVLALGAIEREVKKRKDTLRAQLNQSLTEGQSQQLRSPQGDVLGRVSKSDPEPEWRIVDPAALDDYLRGFPGCVEQIPVIADEPAAIAHLQQCAPHLLTVLDVVDPEAREAALQQSRETGDVAAPGIARVKGAGVVSVTPHKDALTAVARMVRAGHLDLGWAPRPALTPADDRTDEREAS